MNPSKFRDTPERENIIDKLKTSASETTSEQIINVYYPDWLKLSTQKYSNDYPHLQKNWQVLCNQFHTTPKRIVLVEEIHFENDHKILQQVCDFLTQTGYCVRRQEEFVFCSVCGGAIPCVEIYNLLKEKKFPVPQKWRDMCIDCFLEK
jgi:hypothetical protein